MAVRMAVTTQAPDYKKPDGHMLIYVSYWIPWLLGWSSFLKRYYFFHRAKQLYDLLHASHIPLSTVYTFLATIIRISCFFDKR